MIFYPLFLLGTVVIPLTIRGQWWVVLWATAFCGSAGATLWPQGLKEDVPPAMLLGTNVALAVVGMIIAVAVHAFKKYCLRRWQLK